MGPTGHGNSPYNSSSSFAGNPLLVSLPALREQDLLTSADLPAAEAGETDRVDFSRVTAQHERCLRTGLVSSRWRPPTVKYSTASPPGQTTPRRQTGWVNGPHSRP